MGKNTFIKACVLACLLMACPAHAETLSGNNLHEIVMIASTFREAKLIVPPENDPFIESRIENILYSGLFTDCKKHTN
ncbi:MAG: hypothetical protein K6G15_12210 [Desulfovibrio sp.]|nr:hypothetical protein [Desulfovibrio sp.]